MLRALHLGIFAMKCIMTQPVTEKNDQSASKMHVCTYLQSSTYPKLLISSLLFFFVRHYRTLILRWHDEGWATKIMLISLPFKAQACFIRHWIGMKSRISLVTLILPLTRRNVWIRHVFLIQLHWSKSPPRIVATETYKQISKIQPFLRVNHSSNLHLSLAHRGANHLKLLCMKREFLIPSGVFWSVPECYGSRIIISLYNFLLRHFGAKIRHFSCVYRQNITIWRSKQHILVHIYVVLSDICIWPKKNGVCGSFCPFLPKIYSYPTHYTSFGTSSIHRLTEHLMRLRP